MPKISIIIPIYNVEKFIGQCAHSLFKQTLDDLEYIFINDCTLDNSIDILYDILEDYPHRKAQVKILHNKFNLGQSKTRQRGVMAATGDYVIHCDSDDWVEPNWLSCLYAEAIEKDADLVWCDFTKIYEDKSVKYFNNTALTSKEDALLKLITGPRWGSLCINLVKREIAKNKYIRWPSWNYCEDLALVFQYTVLAKRVSYINRSLYWYRNNSQSICNTQDKNKVLANINGAINAIMIELEYSKLVNLYSRFKPYCLTEIFKVKGRVFLIAENSREACRLWRQTEDHLGFFDIWKSNMLMIDKVKISLIYLSVYPILKKLCK